jgi:formate hydrogenlyase subunit 3/multisubunit Na+/H+ antiporter MnhD subunit
VLAQAALLLLLVVFAVKAALLPLYFWLPDTYAAAAAPVAALFAIMTKVGVYAIARITTLLLGPDGGPVAGLATPCCPHWRWPRWCLAAMGALAAQRLRSLVAYLVVGSAGTLLLAGGPGHGGRAGGGLFYLVNSTLVAAAWFLLADCIVVARGGSDALQSHRLAHGWAPLGAAFFVAAVAVAGLPPLGGFLGKALLLQAAGGTPWARGWWPGCWRPAWPRWWRWRAPGRCCSGAPVVPDGGRQGASAGRLGAQMPGHRAITGLLLAAAGRAPCWPGRCRPTPKPRRGSCWRQGPTSTP